MENIGLEFKARGAAGFCDVGPPPVPGPTELLTHTRYSGVTNGTERHALMNDSGRIRYPFRCGYQHVSVVQAVGGEVEGFAAGDTVFIGNHGGHRPWHCIDLAASNERARLCVKLPDGIEHEWCALLGIITGVGMRHSRRIWIGPGQQVWVAGLGPAGQAVVPGGAGLRRLRHGDGCQPAAPGYCAGARGAPVYQRRYTGRPGATQAGRAV